MKTKIFILTIMLFCYKLAFCQNIIADNNKFIEVTGSAEMEVQPDEIVFTIKYSEYWKEEFEKGKVYTDYVTKISIEEIENSVFAELKSVGITKEQMILSDATSSSIWVSEGKGFRKSKTISIILKDFGKVNEIMYTVKTKGVNYMSISELKNKDITNFRKQVKIEAIKAAKEKANYLLQSVGENIGKLLTVVELDNSNNNNYYYPMRQQNSYSNSIMTSSVTTSDNDVNVKKIKLKYEVKVKYEIK